MSRSPLKFYNMYLTSTISVTLVLLLVGLLAILLLASNSLVNRIRENVSLTLVMSEEADSTSYARLEKMLDAAPYCKDYVFVSKEQALEEHIELLGEDPTLFVGYNPLSDSYEVHPTALYAHPDSVAHIDEVLTSLPYVDRVVYQKDVLKLMNHNFGKAAWGIIGVALVMLFIALTLIINTIRLQIYASRFIIRTMSLVGATSWVIRKPFVGRYVLIGFVSSLLAIAVLGGVVYYITFKLGIVLFALSLVNIAFVAGVILVSGILITTLAALFSTGRYIRMKADTMYRI